MITVIAAGFIGEKPQLVVVSQTAQKCEFDVIAERRVKEHGEWVTVYERSTFVAWNDEAEHLATLLDRGSMVNCCGVQETSRWVDRATGQKRSKTKYRLTAWSLMPSRRSPPSGAAPSPVRSQPAPAAGQQTPSARPDVQRQATPDPEPWPDGADNNDQSLYDNLGQSDRGYRPKAYAEERAEHRAQPSDFVEM